MLVHLGRTAVELIGRMVYGVLEGQFDPVEVGKHLPHLLPDVRVHPIVVADVQEASGLEPGPQVARFGWREHHVAVAGHVHEGIIEQGGRSHLHIRHLLIKAGVQLRIAEGHQVGHAGRIGVPIPAPFVLKDSQLDLLSAHHERQTGQGADEKCGPDATQPPFLP